ncbi:transposase, IS4, partial [mine drainage metagenome]
MGLERVCRSTHSDFLAVADPAVLMPVVRALREKIPAAAQLRGNEDLRTLLESVVAYDGSYFEVPVTVAWAMHLHYPKAGAKKKCLPGEEKKGENKADRPMRKHMAQIRLNLHWATRRGVPLGMSIDGAKGSETDAFIKALEPNVIYVIDRGIFSFQCLEELHQHNSHYVARLKKNIAFTTHQQRPLTAEDAAHG